MGNASECSSLGRPGHRQELELGAGFQVCKEQLLSRSFTRANRDMGSSLPLGTHTVTGGRRAMGHRQKSTVVICGRRGYKEGVVFLFWHVNIFYLIHR